MLKYRADIDGLRALAVVLVILFHARPDWLGGGFVGVDVFFVISGYLIGSILMDEIGRKGRIDLVNFWARRTRRLAPSAVLVVVATLLATWVLLPNEAILRAATDAKYALLYATNWQNLAESVDYFADRATPSLFLHFWSLAVEEQFYIYFCLLFLLAKLGGRDRIFRRVALLSMLAALASVIACVILTQTAQPVGYFSTFTRIWQLSAGLAVALLARATLMPSARMGQIGGTLGLLAILFSAALFHGEDGYPGVLAIVPTLATALIIWAGLAPQTPAISGLLSRKALVAIGKRSYALYLWHWPLFQLWRARMDHLTAGDFLLLLAVLAALSEISYRLVENPIRHSAYLRPRPVRSLIILAAVISFAAGGAEWARWQSQSDILVLANGQRLDVKRAEQDIPIIYAKDCHVSQRATALSGCIYGQPDAGRTVVLLGDSHAAQWFAAADDFGKKHGYAVHIMTKSACIPLKADLFNKGFKRVYSECAEWRANALAKISALRPDLVMMGASSQHDPYDVAKADYFPKAQAQILLQKAEEDAVTQLAALAGQVVLIQDTPLLPENPLDCLRTHGSDSVTECQWQQDMARQGFPWSRAHLGETWAVLDMNDLICPKGLCSEIQGDMITYRDTHHLTNSFVLSLRDHFDQRLSALLHL